MNRTDTIPHLSGSPHGAPVAAAGHRVKMLLAALFVCLLPVVGCGDDDSAETDPTAPTEPTPSTEPSEPPATTEPTASSEPATTEPPATTADAFDPLVGLGEVELVADGYGFTEGPQWMADDGVLLFTDGNSIYQVGADDEITTFRRGSFEANGLAVDPEGRLLAAERRTRRVTRTESDGTLTPMTDGFEGAPLNQPNDIAVRSDGTIYFTDPYYGDGSTELEFRGVFRIAPDGGLTAERRGDPATEQPNGIALSPDESRLYVANWAADMVWIFDVAADGSLSEARTLVNTGDGPDGMAVDTGGNLFVTTGAGIEVFAPDGAPWGVIPVPEIPANCAFGGADGRTLYITARQGLYRVTLANPGPY